MFWPQLFAGFLLLIASVQAQVGHLNPPNVEPASPALLRKDEAPPVPPTAPGAAETPSQLASSPSITGSPVPVDVSSLLASLSSELTVSRTSTGVDVSSLLASLSAELSSTISASSSSAAAKTTLASTSHSTPTPASSTVNPVPTSTTTGTPQPTSSSSPSSDDHTLDIILGIVLTLLGLALVFIALILMRRYRRRQSPFSRIPHKDANPVDDDEIATWRGTAAGMGQVQSTHHRGSSSVIFQHAPGWTWTVQSSPLSTAAGEPLPTPPVVARAPNSRSGLTDAAIPGADPFITPTRRQSTRLSKAPTSHGRSKSRRSSVSTSLMDRPGTWCDADEEAVRNYTRGESRGSRGASASTPTPSIIDGRPRSVQGLSPRPRSGPRTVTQFEITRAIA